MKKDLVQVRSPKTGRYLKIDRRTGTIIAHKPTVGPYKDVPVAKKKNLA